LEVLDFFTQNIIPFLQCFRENTLEKALQTLISPGTRQIVQAVGHTKQPTVTSDVLLYVQRIVESNLIKVKPRIIGSSEVNGKT